MTLARFHRMHVEDPDVGTFSTPTSAGDQRGIQQELLDVRRELLGFRRAIVPLREVIAALLTRLRSG